MSDSTTAKKSDGKAPSAPPASASAADKARMPDTDGFAVSGEAPAGSKKASIGSSSSSEERERNEVFGSLVKGDEDIIGLVAYSIYKQNKHDWLVAFNKIKDREPNEDEAFSYIAGESTARRLAIYRHLAQATLEGRGPQVSGGPAKEKFVQTALSNGNAAGKAGSGSSKAMMWIGALIAVVIALYIGAKFGMPGIPR
ncbi:MAG: hypothetical protein KDJ29_20120 [Hyphomicrobiales bacterium]|nr:hypothetical protein [Hyphomicrobiales bacterium]